MKAQNFKCWLIVIVSLIATAAVLRSDSYGIDYTARDFEGAWVGYDNYRLSYYRLQLDAGGKGLCSVVYVDDPAVLYRVDSWKYEGESLIFSLSPLDPNAEEIEMKSAKLGVNPKVLTLEVKGKKIGWTRELSLINEKRYLEKDSRARKRIAEFLKMGSDSTVGSKSRTNTSKQKN